MLGAAVVVGLGVLGAALLFVAYRRRPTPAPRPAPAELQQVADVREDVREALTHEPTADEVRATLARIRTRPR